MDKTTNRCVLNAVVGLAMLAAALGTGAVAVAGPASMLEEPVRASRTTIGITRAEVMRRAKTWVDRKVPYSMQRAFQGYRTDCSGFVSMALKLPMPGPDTTELPKYLVRIDPSQLRRGDIIGNIGPGTGLSAGHVVIFDRFLDNRQDKYLAYEEHGGKDGNADILQHSWQNEKNRYKAYRYKQIAD